MQPFVNSAFIGLARSIWAATSSASEPSPLHVELTLTHIAADKWRADYSFAEPITALDLGPQVGPYRKQSWRPLTPGLVLAEKGQDEGLRSEGKPVEKMSVEIKAYRPYAQGNYAPIDHFSDGGSNFYLGFLYGDLQQGERTRSMDVSFHLQGLPGETVIAPSKPGSDMSGYAYFGPAKPVRAGTANVLIDPQTPAWLREVLLDTTSKVSNFYEHAFNRKLPQPPLVAIAVIGTEGSAGSLSAKGGAVGGGIVYRLEGGGLLRDDPKQRKMMATLMAHELAHVWQQNVSKGGIGEPEPWVHEGGAEAIMLAAMRETGIYTKEEADQYANGLLKECERLKDDLKSYRGFYACGFKRYDSYKLSAIPLWKAMMEKTESSGDVYSEKMIQAILK